MALTPRTSGLRGAARAAFALSLALLCPPPVLVNSRAQQTTPAVRQKGGPHEHALYQIKLDLDFDARAFAGTELVRWTNRDDSPASVLYFHLYPNAPRAQAATGGARTS